MESQVKLSRWWTLGVVAVVLAACSVETSGPAVDEVVPTFTQARTDVCHRTNSGNWNLITVADPALPTHIAHGDAEPGYPVPNGDGETFAPNCSIIPAPATPDFVTFFIRNTNGTITAPWDANIVLEENAAGDGYKFATPSGGQKVGYGTHFFDGLKVNELGSVNWTHVSGMFGAIVTYLNIWVTDGTNYAVIASENLYMGTDFATRTEWKVFESAGNACSGPCPALDWLFDDASAAGRVNQYLQRNGTNATLASLGDNILIVSGPPSFPWPNVGTGAPRGGFGLNLIWGDTQANFTQPAIGQMANLTVTHGGTTYPASN